MTRLTVLAVASEVYPLIKTGGLGDVVGALPAALAREDVMVTTLVPGYPDVTGAIGDAAVAHDYESLLGGPARVLAGQVGTLDLFVLDAPHLYARPGNPYVGPDGTDWPDNAQRFAALSSVAADLGRGAVPGFAPEIVHAHDWQAGLTPAYLHYRDGARPRTVMTVHNLSFQGQFPAELLAEIGLPPRAFSIDGVEYYGMIGYLKAGLALADRLTTVSPTYAAEIRTAEFGMGLDGLLRRRADVLSGILNGIDGDVWNPATDPFLPSNYDARHLKARAANKAALQARLGLSADPAVLLFGAVSRMAWQKGTDLLFSSLPTMLAQGAQFALLGNGDGPFEAAFVEAARAHPGRVAVAIGYDESLAHLLQAGVDALVVPSRFEPCGLTQLCALRYGALPVVSRVGGLADTVVDANEVALDARAGSGVVFAPVTADALNGAVERTAVLWRDHLQWARLQRHAMATDVSWAHAAKRYAALFRSLATSGSA